MSNQRFFGVLVHKLDNKRVFWIKSPGCSTTQWTLVNSYDKVDPTSLSGYGLQRKRKRLKYCFSFGNFIKV